MPKKLHFGFLNHILSLLLHRKTKIRQMKAIRFILISVGALGLIAIPIIIIVGTISGPREANFNRYNVQTIAYVDTIRHQQARKTGSWRLILSYSIGDESYIQDVSIRSNTPLPKGTPVPIRYSQNNPNRAVVHLDYPVPLNDSIEIYFTRYRLGGIHYILRRRQ